MDSDELAHERDTLDAEALGREQASVYRDLIKRERRRRQIANAKAAQKSNAAWTRETPIPETPWRTRPIMPFEYRTVLATMTDAELASEVASLPPAGDGMKDARLRGLWRVANAEKAKRSA
ncbi:hypothetical protein OMK64_01725 [Cellulomonas fimi]|uniref:hypothetical protein n=1 Tax=Cellulomonas fimi TaxID=1708 RepID=UPI00234D4F63|nr:hypothetical protein [Cellulomonas fimi]MDC7120251.1 hypothetical protein [Cellulomonas fimi]